MWSLFGGRIQSSEAMLPPSNFEVLDLRHFSGAQLRPLLTEQAARWNSRLDWDYLGSIELLLDYIDSRSLSGFVALRKGEVLGYTFCVLEAAKAVVGDVYALGEGERQNNPICETLLHHLLEMLQATPGVQRIEAQLLMFPAGALAQPLLSRSFRSVPRLYLQWDFLRQRPAQLQVVDLPCGLRMLPWRAEFYDSAAELIHRAYLGHIDSNINDQYRTLQGSARFLHNVIRFPGCGQFAAENSWVLQDEAAGTIEGVVLSSRIRHDVGHVTQLCIAPEMRDRGLGRILLQQCAAVFAAEGGSHLSLTVTEANTSAKYLYERMGFEVRHRFEAMVWEESGQRS